jgi:hypothetical protein
MRFFRREQRIAWLALFALAMQLVVSFGHVHVHAARQPAHAAAQGACAPGTPAPCPSHDDDDAHCAICWTVSIAGSLVVPAPAALVIPLQEPEPVAPPPSAGTFADNENLGFQARAPPRVSSLA